MGFSRQLQNLPALAFGNNPAPDGKFVAGPCRRRHIFSPDPGIRKRDGFPAEKIQMGVLGAGPSALLFFDFLYFVIHLRQGRILFLNRCQKKSQAQTLRSTFAPQNRHKTAMPAATGLTFSRTRLYYCLYHLNTAIRKLISLCADRCSNTRP